MTSHENQEYSKTVTRYTSSQSTSQTTHVPKALSRDTCPPTPYQDKEITFQRMLPLKENMLQERIQFLQLPFNHE